MNLPDTLTVLTDFWAAYATPIVTGTGAAAALLLAFLLWRFFRTRNRSKVVSTIAAVVVMAWTSEGLLSVGLRKFELPVGFAVATFFVFEAMMLAAGLKAEENRKTKGTPGAAGVYVFLLAALHGAVASFGAHIAGEVVLRLALPISAVGLWWILLTAERDDDKPEWKAQRAAERERKAADREATWTITPRTVLVRLGLMKPGTITVTEAQRQHRVSRMTALGCVIYAGPTWSPHVWWATRRLQRLVRSADKSMIEESRRRVRRSTRAVELIVPGRADTPATGAATPLGDTPTTPQHPDSDTGTDTPAATVPTPLGTVPDDTLVGVLVDGSNTPVQHPAETPPRHPATPRPARGTEPALTSGGTPAEAPTSTPARGGVDTLVEYPADEVLLPVLRNPARVPREADGTVPIKRAMRVLEIGRVRAIRILKAEGLLREPIDDTPDDDTPGVRVNGSVQHPDLAGVTS